MDWSARMAPVDQIVDAELGDEIEFAADGVTFLPINVFVFPPGSEAEIAFAPIDPMSGKPRLKVSKAVISEPARVHRFKIPQLANPALTLYRPENWTPVSNGRYWMVDLQKATQ